jgi:hypothetical protein
MTSEGSDHSSIKCMVKGVKCKCLEESKICVEETETMVQRDQVLKCGRVQESWSDIPLQLAKKFRE